MNHCRAWLLSRVEIEPAREANAQIKQVHACSSLTEAFVLNKHSMEVNELDF